MGSLLETSKQVSGANTTFAWASTEFLRAQGLLGKDLFGPADFPLWAPPDGDGAGIALVSPARAVKKGLKFRSLETTIRDTLAWQKTRPEEKQKLRTGMTMEKEAEVLAKLRAG
jgi:2'-hydroxyisoflavone reductase